MWAKKNLDLSSKNKFRLYARSNIVFVSPSPHPPSQGLGGMRTLVKRAAPVVRVAGVRTNVFEGLIEIQTVLYNVMYMTIVDSSVTYYSIHSK